MADKRISEFTKLTELSGTEAIPVVSAGDNYAVTPTLLKSYATAEVEQKLTSKQDKLTAGSGITISGSTISASVDTSTLATKAEVTAAIGDINSALDAINGEEV
jgi:hypothetical protein